MDNLERNLQALKKNAYYIYSEMENDKLRQCKDESMLTDSVGYHVCIAKNGELITQLTKDNIEFRMNSLYNPTEEAKIWAKQYSTEVREKSHRILLVFGLGNGYHIRQLLGAIDKTDTIIIFEPSKKSYEFSLENFNLESIIVDERVYLIVEGINKEFLTPLLNETSAMMTFAGVELLCLPYYKEIFKDDYEQLALMFTKQLYQTRIDRNTAMEFGREWVDSYIQNIKVALQNELIDAYYQSVPEEIPVIIVAAGPSLEKNVDILKKAKNKAVIIAVDTALGKLSQHEIDVDLAVTIDVRKPLILFENTLAKRIPIIYGMSSNRSAMKLCSGPKVFVDSTALMHKIKYNQKADYVVNSSGSVATYAFDIAKFLGAKTIILVGQDLCFSGENTHVAGVNIDNNVSKMKQVQGNNGEQVWTRHDWYSFLIWFNNAVQNFDGVVINATDGGAKIEGTEIIPLEEAIELYCKNEFDINTILSISRDKHLSEDEVKKKIEGLLIELEQIESISERGKELTKYLILETEKYSEISYAVKDNVGKLSKINKKLEDMPLNSLITQYIFEVYLEEYQSLFNKSKSDKEDRINTYKKAHKVYNAVNDAAKHIKKMLENELV